MLVKISVQNKLFPTYLSNYTRNINATQEILIKVRLRAACIFKISLCLIIFIKNVSRCYKNVAFSSPPHSRKFLLVEWRDRDTERNNEHSKALRRWASASEQRIASPYTYSLQQKTEGSQSAYRIKEQALSWVAKTCGPWSVTDVKNIQVDLELGIPDSRSRREIQVFLQPTGWER